MEHPPDHGTVFSWKVAVSERVGCESVQFADVGFTAPVVPGLVSRFSGRILFFGGKIYMSPNTYHSS